MKLVCHRYTSFRQLRSTDNKTLRQQVKEEYGIGVRRLDNFTLCGLAAVAQLRGSLTSFRTLSLVSCASYFSIELVQQMLRDLQNNQPMRPLEFVSTVGNAANYYIAKEFNISGGNLFLGADQQALQKSLVFSALQLNDSTQMTETAPQQAVVLLVWQEDERQRVCHCLLLTPLTAQHSLLPVMAGHATTESLKELAMPCIIDTTSFNFLSSQI